ncbi:MAG: type secretion system protein VirB11 [Pseudomonadota bacterium]|jgi:broad-specificity NMP kinase|nr:type secretion system protein VirB11 [Pseudomonadota bacterium]MDQ1310436.1 type secretion system protein VirB11 [Pseudomonadota bacterium]
MCKKNIVVSGATGSGKTTLTKALVLEIPRDERLIVLEQLTLLVKESPAGREMARTDVRALLDELVDVVVQCGVEGQRAIRGLMNPPAPKRRGIGFTANVSEPE